MERIDCLNKILAKAKQDEGKNYVTFTDLKKKLGANGKKLFGLKAEPTTAEMTKALQTYIAASEFVILKGSKSSFLAYKMPLEELLFDFFKHKIQKGAFAPSAIAQFMPMKKDDFVTHFNTLLASGRVTVKIKQDYKVSIQSVGEQIASPAKETPQKPTEIPQTTPTAPQTGDRELFRRAYEALEQGSSFVRINLLRKKLGWNEGRFDTLLTQLRAERIVQLHAGEVGSMSDEDIKQCFTDENNFFYSGLTMHRQ